MIDTLTPDELATLEKTTIDRIEHGLAPRLHTYQPAGASQEAKCDLHVFIIKPDRMAAVVLSEREDNPGRSVTNAIEHLAGEIYRRHLDDLVPPGRVAWLQHDQLLASPKRGYERVTLEARENGGRTTFHSPKWQTLRASEAATEEAP